MLRRVRLGEWGDTNWEIVSCLACVYCQKLPINRKCYFCQTILGKEDRLCTYSTYTSL